MPARVLDGRRRRVDRYLTARAIQLCARGIPQVYYAGLLAGVNDTAAVAVTGEGRSINRHDDSVPGVQEALARSVVQRLLALIRLRNTHPAFDGELSVAASGHVLRMRWEHEEGTCELEANMRAGTCTVRASGPDGRWSELAA